MTKLMVFICDVQNTGVYLEWYMPIGIRDGNIQLSKQKLREALFIIHQ